MTIQKLIEKFPEVYLADFEFNVNPGEKPKPICGVFKNLRTGQVRKMWGEELPSRPPFLEPNDYLLVAYYASAEMDCYLSLGWDLPRNILDLYVEFRCLNNGLVDKSEGHGLLSALRHYGLASINESEKNEMRNLAIRGGPFTPTEKQDLLDYCESDVLSLEKLITAMSPKIDLERAIHRGAFMRSTSMMQFQGIPMDTVILSRLRKNWAEIKQALIAEIDQDFNCFENGSFKQNKFEAYILKHKLYWPRLPSGKLALDSETFKQMSLRYPQTKQLHDLRETLSKLKLNDLAVGEDGRNRTLLSPFSSKTSRSQPSTSKFIFGLPSWSRGLIRPQPGFSIAYIDWSQQEFGIAAVLSADKKMQAAYLSSDPYLTFAKQAGALPPDATKKSDPEIRELFKKCSLGVLYGMGAHALSAAIAKPLHEARNLLKIHQRTYKDFWSWSDKVSEQTMIKNFIRTVFGWTLFISSKAKEKTVRNFPMQANGAEMMRIAVMLMHEKEISVCATVHDAILIEDRHERIAETVAIAKSCMAEASRIVLDGFELKSDVKVVSYPDRFLEERGRPMWDRIMDVLGKLEHASINHDHSSNTVESTQHMGPVILYVVLGWLCF